MPTTYANSIDNNPIYAARAEADQNGLNIDQNYAKKSELAGKQDTISDLATIRSGAAAGATAVQPGDLATVATTGDYDDLTDKPTIPSGVQLVPAATASDADKVLTVDSLGVPGWAVVPAQSTGLFQATYGTSTYNEVRNAVAANKIVYCYVSGRMAFLAYVGSDNYEFQYYRSNSSSSGTDSIFVYKVSSSGWTTTERTVKAGNISYPVTRVNVNGASAMTGTVANITIPAAPTVDQTYDASSSNAQSGTAVAGAISTKQDTISDLATIRSGAALGATAVQPGDLATVATTGDYDDLTDKPTIPSGTQLVPAATSADANKVLTVNAQGTPSWAAAQSVTVDQTYDPFSTNAQSGIAVGSALHTKQNPLTAGDGISLDENDEISAKLGDGLEIGTSLSPVTDPARAIGCSNTDIGVSVMQQLSPDVFAAIETTGLTFTVQNLTDNNNVSRAWTYWGNNSLKLYPAICAVANYGSSGPVTDPGRCLVLSTTGIDVASSSGTIPAGTQFTYNLDDINTSLSTITWETISDQPGDYSLSVVWRGSNSTLSVSALGSYTRDAVYEYGALNYQTVTFGAIAVSNPLPASTVADADKVLKVNASGAPEWATGGGSTYSAGEGIDITDDVISVEAPVDIVAGPGIVIDNPDGNTLRVSVEADAETVLWENYTFADNKASSVAMSETPFNFSQVRITFYIEATSDSWGTLQTQLIDMVALASNTNKNFTLNGTVVYGSQLIVRGSRCNFNGTSITESATVQWYNGGLNNMSNALHIYRVVGVHRIANN